MVVKLVRLAQPYFDIILIVLKIYPDINGGRACKMHITEEWTVGIEGGLHSLRAFLVYYLFMGSAVSFVGAECI